MGILQKILDVASGSDRRFARFWLIPLDPHTGEQLGSADDLPPMRLQYWPESLEYSRGSIGWEEKSVPGSSHPLQNWTSNGAPTVSFEAVFTQDNDPGYTSSGSGVLDDLGSFLDPNSESNQSTDINAAAAWFAGASNPKYADTNQSPAQTPVDPPPIIQIVPEYLPSETSSVEGAKKALKGFNVGNALQLQANDSKLISDGIDSIRGVTLSHHSQRDFFGVMTDFSVNYPAFFPSGAPRYITISLSFSETIQLGDVIIPHDRRDNVKIATKYRFGLGKGRDIKGIA